MTDQFTADDRAAMRAFLQRSEVRLSSVHRAATALLSGAGVLVLLPALTRDALVTVARTLLRAERTPTALLVLAGLALVIAAIVAVVWLLLAELTRFYFHSNHLGGAHGVTFAPRFGLSSLRLPDDELSAPSTALLGDARADADNIELVVPPNDRARRRIDQQVAAHAGRIDGANEQERDLARAVQLLRLVGAHDHALVDEVARAEYGMARHTQRLQVIVLRYLKALLVVIVSLLLVTALAAVVTPPSPAGADATIWVVALLLTWSPTAMVAVASPVRWLGALLRSEGAARTGVRYDPELTRLERVIALLSTGVTACAVAAGVALMADDGGLAAHPTLAGVLGAGVVLQAAALLWGRRIGGGGGGRPE